MKTPPPRWEGALFAAGAFFLWGILPLYWKLLLRFRAELVLAHRILWSSALLTLFLFLVGKGKRFTTESLRRRTWAATAPSAFLIGGNWYLYIWAVNSGFVLETSLGYFISPLVSVALGLVFLGERLRRGQKIALALVTLAVTNLLWNHNRVPWVAVALALSFGFYGLLKKKSSFDSLMGLCLETNFLALPAFAAALFFSCLLSALCGRVGATHFRWYSNRTASLPLWACRQAPSAFHVRSATVPGSHASVQPRPIYFW